MAGDDRLYDLVIRWDESRQAGREVSAEQLCGPHPELLGPLQERIASIKATDWLLENVDNNADVQVPFDGRTLVPVAFPDSYSLEAFVDAIVQSGVMTAGRLQEVREQSGARDAEQFAHELIRQNCLTRFQIHSLVEGNGPPLVLGNYVILDRLGAGGMGDVLRARHRVMKRVVALKLLPPGLVKDRKAVERFRREVETAAKLSHPRIVTAFDADEADGRHFLVMEYIEGQDLGSRVAQKGPLPVAEAVNYIEQAAQGLEYAHGQGIVHRDIKPANLLADEHGAVKILDMGLARLKPSLEAGIEASMPAHLTAEGSVMGTIDYMAPEQAVNAKHADARSDLYSLGCTLYFLLTGQRVYGGDTVLERILAHREREAPLLENVRDDVPPQLSRIFRRMVEKNPDDRYPTATALVEDLGACREVLAPTGCGRQKRHRVPLMCAVLGIGLGVIWAGSLFSFNDGNSGISRGRATTDADRPFPASEMTQDLPTEQDSAQLPAVLNRTWTLEEETSGEGVDAFQATAADSTAAEADPRNSPAVASFPVPYAERSVVFTVTNLDDAGPGSLRDSIRRANERSGANVVKFAPDLRGVILLSGQAIYIRDSLTINGPGADVLTIDGANNSSIFEINNVNDETSIDVEIRGLRLTGGRGRGNGGAIRSFENLAVVNSVIARNSCSARGGGIHVVGKQGGRSVTIHGSTISDNMAPASKDGIQGGGVYVGCADSLTIVDSTISGNTVNGDGGGVMVWKTEDVVIRHSTIVGNTAKAPDKPRVGAGGLWASNAGTTTIEHTIIAANSAGSANRTDVLLAPNAVVRYSLVGDKMGSGLKEAPIGSPDARGNLVGDPNGYGLIDPGLGPLQSNGGPTPTHALLPDSPAIDAGDPAFTRPPAFDQRGTGFRRIAGNRIDIGAFEHRAPSNGETP